MIQKQYDVLTVGLQCIDITVSRVPDNLLHCDLSVVDSVQLGLGGDALNQAIVLSQLGARTAFMGLAGNDRLGDVLLDQLRRYALHTHIARTATNTAVSIVLPDADGERHFLYQPGSNNAFCFRHINEEAVRSAACVSVGGCLSLPGLDGGGLCRLLALAKESGARTAIDFRISGAEIDRARLLQMLQLADYVLPSQWEASVITGETHDPAKMAEALHSLGAHNCIIKLGGAGCFVSADGFTGVIPSFPCRCVDTTGAGDSFVAAFLYAKSRGWDITHCARFANAAGAIAVEHAGANMAITSAQQVLNRMRGIC